MSQPSSHVPESEGTHRPADPSQEWINRRATEQATRAANARQVSGRRRFVDPTTCERDYTDQEVEFMNALDENLARQLAV